MLDQGRAQGVTVRIHRGIGQVSPAPRVGPARPRSSIRKRNGPCGQDAHSGGSRERFHDAGPFSPRRSSTSLRSSRSVWSPWNAGVHIPHLAHPIDQVARRHGRHLDIRHQRLLRVVDGRERGLKPVDKGAVSRGILVDADGQDDEAPWGIGRVELGIKRERRLAGRAPGGPEVDQDDLPGRVPGPCRPARPRRGRERRRPAPSCARKPPETTARAAAARVERSRELRFTIGI